MSDQQYGMVGWEEFSSNRSEIFDKFDRAKTKNKSRKVKTEHGNVAEAAVREWLESYLPKKYGVTSGYIVPNFVELSDPYNLGHFDIIIYDIFESPVLWVEQSDDKSELGKARAIPAQHVKSVLEIKSNLTAHSAAASIKKLNELNDMKKFFPETFSCGSIFIELQERNIGKKAILNAFHSQHLPHNFWGGIVLRCSVDNDLSGSIYFSELLNNNSGREEGLPLIVAGKEMNVVQGNPSGKVQVGPGFGVRITLGPDRIYHSTGTTQLCPTASTIRLILGGALRIS